MRCPVLTRHVLLPDSKRKGVFGNVATRLLSSYPSATQCPVLILVMLLSGGVVLSWGLGTYGELGDLRYPPTRVLCNARYVAFGVQMQCCLYQIEVDGTDMAYGARSRRYLKRYAAMLLPGTSHSVRRPPYRDRAGTVSSYALATVSGTDMGYDPTRRGGAY
eukprot:3653366-Rhodomonas_salina.3